MFKRLMPSPDIRDLIVDSLHDEGDVLKIIVTHNHGKETSITFDSYVSYRKLNESYCAESPRILDKMGVLGEIFLVATDSEYLQWFRKEADGLADDLDLKHYAINAIDYVIDVISEEAPTFSEIVLSAEMTTSAKQDKH